MISLFLLCLFCQICIPLLCPSALSFSYPRPSTAFPFAFWELLLQLCKAVPPWYMTSTRELALPTRQANPNTLSQQPSNKLSLTHRALLPRLAAALGAERTSSCHSWIRAGSRSFSSGQACNYLWSHTTALFVYLWTRSPAPCSILCTVDSHCAPLHLPKATLALTCSLIHAFLRHVLILMDPFTIALEENLHSWHSFTA